MATRQHPGEGVSRLDVSLIAALLGNFLVRIDGGMVSSLMTFFLADIHKSKITEVPPITYGVLLSVFYVSELIFSPVMGAKSDQHGNRRILLIAPLFGMVGVFVAGLAAFSAEFRSGLFSIGGISSLLIALGVTRLLQGFAAAASIPAILSFLSAKTEHSIALRGRVMSIFEVTTGVGLLVGPPIGTVLWEHTRSYGFIITGLAFLCSAGFFWFIRESKSQSRARGAASSGPGTWQRLTALLRKRELLRFAPAWLAVNAIVGLWGGQFIYQLVNGSLDDDQFLTGSFPPGVISAAQLGLGLTFCVGIIGWGFTFGRLREAAVLRISTIGLFGACASALMINWYGHNPAILTTGIVIGAIMLTIEAGFAPAAVTYLARLAGQSVGERGLLMGVYSVVLGLGQFVGHYIGGYFAQAGGVNGIILLTFLLSLIATYTIFKIEPLPVDAAGPFEGQPRMSLHA